MGNSVSFLRSSFLNPVLCALLLLAPTHSFAEVVATRVKLDRPYFYPQTSLFVGTAGYTSSVKQGSLSSDYNFSATGLNTFGFDIEVNALRFMNIGATMRVENMGNVDPNAIFMPNRFTTQLGGFARFFYMPSFLQSKTVSSSLFARVDLGGGPVVMGMASGISGQLGFQAGLDVYLTRWVGLGLSYGYLLEAGSPTLLAGLDFHPDVKVTSFSSRAQTVTVAFKTNLF